MIIVAVVPVEGVEPSTFALRMLFERFADQVVM